VADHKFHNPGTKARDKRAKTHSNRRNSKDVRSAGAVIATVADVVGSTFKAGVVAPYTWAKEPTTKGFVKSVRKFDKIIRDSGTRAKKRFRDSDYNFPKRKRTKSKTKAVNTRLGGS